VRRAQQSAESRLKSRGIAAECGVETAHHRRGIACRILEKATRSWPRESHWTGVDMERNSSRNMTVFILFDAAMFNRSHSCLGDGNELGCLQTVICTTFEIIPNYSPQNPHVLNPSVAASVL
jgi:hypothetical protein